MRLVRDVHHPPERDPVGPDALLFRRVRPERSKATFLTEKVFIISKKFFAVFFEKIPSY
jgi:hypothetical protein